MIRTGPELGRTGWVLPVLLGLVLSLTALLGVEAWRATRSHLAVADEVLRDYAALATAEGERRIMGAVGYRVYMLLEAVRAVVPAHGPLATPAPLDVPDDGRSTGAMDMVIAIVQFDPGNGALHLTGDLSSGFDDGELAVALRDGWRTLDWRRGVALTRAPSGSPLALIRLGPEESPRFAGVLLDQDVIGVIAGDALMNASLLPEVLVGVDADNSGLHISLIDAEGVELFAEGPSEAGSGSYFYHRRAMSDDYFGVFKGATLTVSLERDLADSLIIGGLPRSRLPLLLLAGVLVVILAAATIVLMMRERRLNAMREDFVARVSHELRTPLTQIRMFAETLLLGRARDEAGRARALEIIDRESRRLGHLVENVLQFSRSQRDGLELTCVDTDMSVLVDEVIAGFDPLTGEAHIEFDDRCLGRCRPRVDPDAMRQVLINLLDNAVRYGPPRQTILVSLRPIEAGVELSVEDEGPGVPSEERRHVFAPYRRLDRESARAIAGTGIGLAVVEDLVLRMQGEVVVGSNPSGGARFSVSMPVVDDAPEQGLGDHPGSIAEGD